MVNEDRLGPVPPNRGWRRPGAGRAVHVAGGAEYQATTVQAAGLYPFTAGSGAPLLGVPIGRHQLWGETVLLDPFEWLSAGLITNTGIFVLGQPGAGKSALAKRLVMGMAATGSQVLVLGDTKPDYTRVVEHLGGRVIRVGRGLDRINPLDAGPLGAVLARMSGPDAEQLRLEVRGRRLTLLIALCTLVRDGGRISNAEEVVLGRAVDLLADRHVGDPVIPDVLAVLDQGPDTVRAAARAAGAADYRRRVDDLVATLRLLCEGTLAGVFDAATSTPIDLSAKAVSIDISRVVTAGDKLVAAAMLSTWSYGYAVIDAAAALAEQGLAPRRRHLAVMDELWRALRGAPGLVEPADALTRLSRNLGVAQIMLTHSLDDLEALGNAEDRAKGRGMAERCAVKVLAALPGRELDRIGRIVRLSGPERDIVSSWAAPDALVPGAAHPGRGKYLLKTGERAGMPVALYLVGDEFALYDTDTAVKAGAR
ncbi:hypothetical protein KZZ52_41690 [Dactylosporangium sp. AC04546]|uniref:hypothetical protein n=1 Tax=Dactylosporangium sp. AC04546 TaxID=2862460 RepID=UPI0021067F5E|nr:hypothetical protein [Dactylosporangium sp. AC04546]WVK80439.1 hypothetical protein KZZ52_41690 [Dactylosporangium sp. AC04546]